MANHRILACTLLPALCMGAMAKKDKANGDKKNSNENNGLGQGNGGGQPVEFVVVPPAPSSVPVGPSLTCLDMTVHDFLQSTASQVPI
jgi:hypothetical protein